MPPRGFGTAPGVRPLSARPAAHHLPQGHPSPGGANFGARSAPRCSGVEGAERRPQRGGGCAELRGALGRQLQRAGRAARRFLLFLLPLFPFPPTTFSSPASSPAPQLSPGLQSLRQRPPRPAEGAGPGLLVPQGNLGQPLGCVQSSAWRPLGYQTPPQGSCLLLPVKIAPVLSISSPVRGYKYLSGILIAASAGRLVRVTQSSTNGPTRAGCPDT